MIVEDFYNPNASVILCGLCLMGSPVSEGVPQLTAEESYLRGVQGVPNTLHLTSAS